MSAIMAGSNACVCSIRSLSIGRPWCRKVGTGIASWRHLELPPMSGRRCFRSIGPTPFSDPSGNFNVNKGKDPSARRIACAVFAAIASGAFFDHLGTTDNDSDNRSNVGIRGPMVARMTQRRDTSLQIRFGDSILVDHAEPRSSTTIAGANDEEIVLLLPEDEESISPFLYYLMKQVKLVRVRNDGNCQYNLPIGLPGLGCAYCNSCSTGKASRSQVFPLDRRTFPIMVRKHLYNHIQRCERCPLEVKLELRRLKKLEAGTKISREERLFFKELWFRMGHKAAI